MKKMPHEKYCPFAPVALKDRTWPDRVITRAPRWCSVDLRDGNQALVTPMNLSEKLEFFHLLVKLGFKEIEVAFPAAAQVEFDFVRTLIEDEHVPDDVTIQVLVQCRENLIERTFESLKGTKKAIVHLYNSTSTLQRDVVFGKSKDEIRQIAVDGAKWAVREASRHPGTDWRFEYSPESFMGTELPYALEVVTAVMEVLAPTPERKLIVNLPNTVELCGPHVYADMIEWFHRKMPHRDRTILSVHTHNDRGSAVAAAELAVQAGADRVEGTLFGNGERTGNVDVVTLALNLLTHGVDPELDFSHLNHVIEVSNRLTRLPVHARQPYAGELVYTAFSGSHQDAIHKGMRRWKEVDSRAVPPKWEVPYLPIDPQDVGRTYESIIRINSQSGKGGVAWVMETEYGFLLPKTMHPEFGKVIQGITDRSGEELPPEAIFRAFEEEYLHRTSPWSVKDFHVAKDGSAAGGLTEIEVNVTGSRGEAKLAGRGNGPVDAFAKALIEGGAPSFRLTSYHQHSLEGGSDSRAAAYIQIELPDGRRAWGVGVDPSTTMASARAVCCAINRVAAAEVG